MKWLGTNVVFSLSLDMFIFYETDVELHALVLVSKLKYTVLGKVIADSALI
jgi:hypothetical protein